MVHKSLRSPTTEAPVARYTLMAIAFLFLVLFLILPLAAVFIEAFRKGAGEFVTSLGDPDTLVGPTVVIDSKNRCISMAVGQPWLAK